MWTSVRAHCSNYCCYCRRFCLCWWLTQYPHVSHNRWLNCHNWGSLMTAWTPCYSMGRCLCAKGDKRVLHVFTVVGAHLWAICIFSLSPYGLHRQKHGEESAPLITHMRNMMMAVCVSKNFNEWNGIVTMIWLQSTEISQKGAIGEWCARDGNKMEYVTMNKSFSSIRCVQ